MFNFIVTTRLCVDMNYMSNITDKKRKKFSSKKIQGKPQTCKYENGRKKVLDFYIYTCYNNY